MATIKKPKITDARIIVNEGEAAKLWLPSLTQDLQKRDIAAWAFGFQWHSPEKTQTLRIAPRTVATIPIYFPEFDIDHEAGQNPLTTANLYGSATVMKMRIVIEAKATDNGGGGAVGPGKIAAWLSQTTATEMYTGPDEVPVNNSSYQDFTISQTAQDLTGSPVLPTGLWYVHIGAEGDLNILPSTVLTTTIKRDNPNFNKQDNGFWIETV